MGNDQQKSNSAHDVKELVQIRVNCGPATPKQLQVEPFFLTVSYDESTTVLKCVDDAVTTINTSLEAKSIFLKCRVHKIDESSFIGKDVKNESDDRNDTNMACG